jgi:DNA-directed RNA polymerase subunit beta'
VEEIFEARKRPKGESIIADIGGVVHIERIEGLRAVRVVDSEVMEDRYDIPGNWGIKVEDGDEVQAGDLIASRGDDERLAKSAGRVRRDGRDVSVYWERRDEHEYEIPSAARLLVTEGERIDPGHQLTEGSQNPQRILAILGREATQHYLLQEVQRVYRSQGVNINEKHFEVILRKMLNKVIISSSGDSGYLLGELVDRLALSDLNKQLLAEGMQPAKAKQVLLGITKAALETDSFLSASSFQHTIKVLARAALEGKQDTLTGLKENVIIGKLIPAGTGFRGDLEVSDGPIESYEGVVLVQAEPEEEAPAEVAAAPGIEEAQAAAMMAAAAQVPEG